MISTTKTIFLFTLCIVSLTGLAQDADFSLVSVNSTFEAANAVAMDKETSAIYVGGTVNEGIEDFLGSDTEASEIDNLNAQGQGEEDCYLAKLSYTGEVLWLMTFGSDKEDQLFDLEIGPDYNIYVTGTFEKSFTIPSVNGLTAQDVGHIGTDSDFDIFTASFTPEGVLRWIEVDGGQGHDQGLSLDVGDDGVAVLAVYESWANSFTLGGSGGYSSSTSDYAVIKRDFSGTHLWTTTMGSSSNDYDFSDPFYQTRVGVACDGEDVYAVAKWSGPECFFFNDEGTWESDKSLFSSDGEFDFFVTKINSEGSFDWTQPIYSDYSGDSKSCAIDVDCNAVYVAGIMDADASNWLWFPSGYIWSWGDSSELFLTSLDKSSGIDNWFAICYDYGDATELSSVETNGTGNIALVGSLEGDLYLPNNISVSSISSEDALIAQFNTQGTCLDAFVLGDSGNTFALAADMDNDGNACVVGITDYNWTDDTSDSDNSFIHAFQLSDSGISPCCTLAPTSGVASVSDDTPCAGSVVDVELTGYFGNVQWTYSSDNGATWIVPSGFTDEGYSFPVWSDVLIKAIVSLPGCASTSSNIVAITVEAMEISCPSEVTVGVDNTCTYTMLDHITPYTFSDCPAIGYTQSPAVGTVLNIGVTTCSIISPDGVVMCSFPINVVDNEAPDLTCPPNQAVFPNEDCDYVLGDYTSSIWAGDNCSSDLIITQSPPAGTIVYALTQVIVSAEDEVGNSSSCSFNVLLVQPIGTLQVSCPADQELSMSDACSALLPDYTASFVLNSCATATITQSPPAGTQLFSDQTVTLTATAGFGSTQSCDFEVVLVDKTEPSISCPGNDALAPNSDCDFVVPDYLNQVVVTDNCDADVELTQSPAAGTTISNATVVTITATDDSGNSNSCFFTVTVAMVVDIGPPNCPGDQLVTLDQDCQFELPDYSGSVVSTVDCGPTATIFQSPAAGTMISSDTEVFLSTSNAFNALSTCSFWVLTEDQSDPVMELCPDDIAVDFNAACGFNLGNYLSLVSATDNCDSDLTYFQVPVAGTPVFETTLVVITVTDDAGNSSQCEFKIIPKDNTAPSLDCLGDQTRSLDSFCQYVMEDFTALMPISDNCSTPSVIQSPAAGTVIMNNQVVFVTVSDDSGNTSTCEFFLTLVDDSLPTMDCPSEITLQADENCQITIPDFEDLVLVEDNCGINAFVQDYAPGVILDAEPLAISMKVEDTSGMGDECVVNVVIEDLIAPVINCPGNQVVAADDMCQFLVPDYSLTVQNADNCTDVDFIQSPSAGTVLDSGLHTISIEVTDENGNGESCVFTVTVQDVSNPEIVCIGNQTIAVDSNCSASLPDYASTMSISDNCGIASVTQTPAAGSMISTDTNVSIEAIDVSGLTLRLLF